MKNNNITKTNINKTPESAEKLTAIELETRSALIGCLLSLFLHKHTRKTFLEESLKLVQNWIGTECAGIRVTDEQGNVPYEAHYGFDNKFIKSEMWLSVNLHQCVCTRVISGAIEPQDTSAITPGGSFCSNDSLQFLNNLNEDEKARFRGVCIENGYLTVGVIPIRYGNKILGAIHLADYKSNALSFSKLAFVESSLAPLIGEGIYRFNVKTQLQRNLDTQTTLSSLLKYSLEDMTLEDILSFTLDLIHSSRLFSGGEKGAIFLIEDETEDLCLKVSRGFNKAKQVKCSRIPLGTCLCGLAAQTRSIVFSEFSDPKHMIKTPGQTKHSNYCVPIQTGKNLLGVVNLCLETGHRRDQNEEDFLSAVANALAGIISRKRSEEKLHILSRRLVNVQEEERRAIALELHDQIGQSLTALKLMVNQAGRVQDDKKQSLLNEAQTAVTELIIKVREMSLNLRPSMLDDLGLLPTLVWMFDQSQTKSKLKIIFKHSGLDKELPGDVSLAAYRIIQEALTNIMCFAGVNTAFVDVWTRNRLLQIRVEDKGKGFKISTSDTDSSSGLQGMRERAILLGGSLTVESIPGSGTVVSADLPLPDQPATLSKPKRHKIPTR